MTFVAAAGVQGLPGNSALASPTAGPAGTPQDLSAFKAAASSGANIVPLVQRLFADQLSPVTAYR
jgi:hypothetical protein